MIQAHAARATTHSVTKFSGVGESPTKRVVINKGVVSKAEFASRGCHNCTIAAALSFYTLLKKVREMGPKKIERLQTASKSSLKD